MSEILFVFLLSYFWVSFGALPYTPCHTEWKFAGPTGYIDISNGNISAFSATNAIVSGDNKVWYVGTVNGGVWRTKDLYANNYNPEWVAVTDNQPVTCVSIGAIAVAEWDANLVAAGCGGTTSGMMQSDWNVLNTGDWSGLMLSKDAGDTWSMTAFPPNFYITAIVFLNHQDDPTILVSARSNAFNPNIGGIWISKDMGQTWNQTFHKPVYHLVSEPDTSAVFASLAMALDTVYMTVDGGSSWMPLNNGLDWGNRVPSFTTLAIQKIDPKNPILFMGAFTVNDTVGSVETEVLWISQKDNIWKKIPGMPCTLDPDSMPKDRMALLTDPIHPNILYIAGNADGPGPCEGGDCSTVFRIDWQKGEWTFASGSDTIDNSMPHPDCRGLAWDYSTDNLLLVHDGGLQVRLSPRTTKGKWLGLAGNIGVMEFYSAHWDNRLERWIAGAQDNDVQITQPMKHGTLRAYGFLGCDGMRTGIDNMHNPARLISSCQFIDGLTVFSGDPLNAIPMKLNNYFTEATAFPFFLPPWTLNSQKPDQLLFWVNGTSTRPAGVWELTVPSNTTKDGVPLNKLGIWDIDRRAGEDMDQDDLDQDDLDQDDMDEDDMDQDDDIDAKRDEITELMNPKPVVNTAPVYEIVSGGYVSGKSDPDLVIAMNNTSLFQKRGQGKMTISALPSKFASPTILPVIGNATVLAPISHGKTVSLTVSPADSQIIAVTGWPQDMTNGTEHVWLTQDGSKTWKDITGNLFEAVATIFKIRPSGILIIEFSDHAFDAILVGTVSGTFISWTDSVRQGKWSRVGLLSDFPQVKVAGLSYEHYSDTLVAATYGRGVYILKNAKQLLLLQRNQQVKMTCSLPLPPKPASSSKYFPPQEP